MGKACCVDGVGPFNVPSSSDTALCVLGTSSPNGLGSVDIWHILFNGYNWSHQALKYQKCSGQVYCPGVFNARHTVKNSYPSHFQKNDVLLDFFCHSAIAGKTNHNRNKSKKRILSYLYSSACCSKFILAFLVCKRCPFESLQYILIWYQECRNVSTKPK